MRRIDYIVIHHSASSYGDSKLIDRWHRERGFKKIGYHYIILNGFRKNSREYEVAFDGFIEPGRKLSEIGAHVKGYNKNSIGICLIGNHLFTLNQFISLKILVKELKNKFPTAKVVGHCDLDPVNKPDCPGFDVDTFIAEVLD